MYYCHSRCYDHSHWRILRIGRYNAEPARRQRRPGHWVPMVLVCRQRQLERDRRCYYQQLHYAYTYCYYVLSCCTYLQLFRCTRQCQLIGHYSSAACYYRNA